MEMQLEELPNIGRSIAADLRRIGIMNSGDLSGLEPLATYRRLAEVMGSRHDPCVFHVLLAVRYFFESGVPLPWWRFAEEGERLLVAAQPLKRGTSE